MKHLFIFLTAAFALFNNANAQFSENFDQNLTSLTSNCWRFEQINYATTSGYVINGTGSAYTNPPTSGSGERTIATPFLNVSTTSLAVSFKYKISSKIAGLATRTINIGLLDNNGVFTSFEILTLNKNTATTVLNHSATYTLPTTGVYRLQLRIGGATGDGNSRVIFDDLSVSALPYYGPVNYCNSPAIANDDSYSEFLNQPLTSNVISNDVIPDDNEIYSVSVVTAPATGTLMMNTDGTFTYTPAIGFTGPVTFTYQINDNGYSPALSNIATVTFIYTSPMTLPIKLLSFTTTVSGSQVELKWLVDKNETGDFFEVESSMEGKKFNTIAKIFTTTSTGKKEYFYSDLYAAADMYYRIKIVNEDLSVTYTKVLLVKGRNELMNDLQVIGNPVQQALTLNYTTSSASSVSIEIYSISGAKTIEKRENVSKGLNTIAVQLENVRCGNYVVVVTSGTNRSITKFIKK